MAAFIAEVVMPDELEKVPGIGEAAWRIVLPLTVPVKMCSLTA